MVYNLNHSGKSTLIWLQNSLEIKVPVIKNSETNSQLLWVQSRLVCIIDQWTEYSQVQLHGSYSPSGEMLWLKSYQKSERHVPSKLKFASQDTAVENQHVNYMSASKGTVSARMSASIRHRESHSPCHYVGINDSNTNYSGCHLWIHSRLSNRCNLMAHAAMHYNYRPLGSSYRPLGSCSYTLLSLPLPHPSFTLIITSAISSPLYPIGLECSHS